MSSPPIRLIFINDVCIYIKQVIYHKFNFKVSFSEDLIKICMYKTRPTQWQVYLLVMMLLLKIQTQ